MILRDLVHKTRLYARDNNSYMFPDTMITIFLNEAIDRIRQYPYFEKMSYLKGEEDSPNLLPSQYHYMLALFAASRCYEHDERFYEGVERRNEFEGMLEEIISNVQTGNLVLYDDDGNAILDTTRCTEYVKDVYFNGGGKSDNSIL